MVRLDSPSWCQSSFPLRADCGHDRRTCDRRGHLDSAARFYELASLSLGADLAPRGSHSAHLGTRDRRMAAEAHHANPPDGGRSNARVKRLSYPKTGCTTYSSRATRRV